MNSQNQPYKSFDSPSHFAVDTNHEQLISTTYDHTMGNMNYDGYLGAKASHYDGAVGLYHGWSDAEAPVTTSWPSVLNFAATAHEDDSRASMCLRHLSRAIAENNVTEINRWQTQLGYIILEACQQSRVSELTVQITRTLALGTQELGALPTQYGVSKRQSLEHTETMRLEDLVPKSVKKFQEKISFVTDHAKDGVRLIDFKKTVDEPGAEALSSQSGKASFKLNTRTTHRASNSLSRVVNIGTTNII
ncbi:hypothetical protein BC629DRAFT_566147 [Irpex lacteus]|nr:hypothetical protein BC629DRAFT_566147 [Irpex lacteus]